MNNYEIVERSVDFFTYQPTGRVTEEGVIEMVPVRIERPVSLIRERQGWNLQSNENGLGGVVF